ncbi:hypothetical protein J5Y09_12620 [Roseomonas sp. PWR1]|uniref:Uncharacterized protein n=1 Tax=Roseomonas nitratireducens TaxID=2820810 RepID=A0ABS4AVE7_9PROT|nr:hypothetical protein [Neoroseomonas nitratireducens]MBP0464756.1 hypothetical protein [Neoroseomonas nitratireducens]
MRLLIIGGAALALFAGAAEASSTRGGHGGGGHGGGGHGGGSSGAQPRAEAEAEASATARQRQRQRQNQTQTARGGNARATVIVNNGAGGAGGGTGVSGGPTGAAATTGAGVGATGAAGTLGADGGGAYHSTVSGTTTLRTAPDVAAPAIWSNNPCIISASGSVSVVGFGASIGAGIEDPDCTRRANAQLLAVLGQPDAAREVLCANREVREAFMRSGRPCAADAANFRPVRATVAPAAAVAIPAAAAPAPQPVAAPAPAAFCQPQPGESAADRLMRQHNCR